MTIPINKYSKEKSHERIEDLILLLNTIGDGAILLDAKWTVLLINPVACEILELQKNLIIGKYINNILPFSIKEQILSFLTKLSTPTSDVTASNELYLTLPKKYIRLLFNPTFDEESETLIRITITIQDISKEVQLNEIKSQFISNISHELRTPLFNIQSFLETLVDYYVELSDKEKMEFLEIANKETQRLTRLVNDMLNLSKLESHSYRYVSLEPLDIRVLVEQTLKSYQLIAQEKRISLSIEFEDNLPSIIGNYDLIFQVLSNLIDNALKFSYTYSKLVIRIFSCLGLNIQPISARFFIKKSIDKFVRIEISDTGIGINAKKQKFIFERFSRVENTIHTLEGTGLGLSIVKNIIQKHYSEIFVKSEIFVGTTFWFDMRCQG